jgi:ribosomal protein L7Ae-like RNA K-turn-binding protein
METSPQRQLLGLIGLGVRGRGAVIGVQQVREAARRGKLYLAIAAPDASINSLDKVLPLLRARGITVVAGPPAAELGSAAGRESSAVIGIVDKGLAKGIQALGLAPMPDGRNEEMG